MKTNPPTPQGPVKIPAANLKGTPYAGVKFHFVMVTPELAHEWLKRNRRNRKPKKSTISMYALDYRNGEWITNHQGIAFDEDGNLMDGQNRLYALIESEASCLLLVSTGWPKKPGKNKLVTMDTVDHGCVRSLADTLELQHGIENARGFTNIIGALNKIVFEGKRFCKTSPAQALEIIGLFAEEMKWLSENVATQTAFRNANVTAVVALGLAVWPKQTREFYLLYKTGAGIKSNSPIYHLRNRVLDLSRRSNTASGTLALRMGTAHYLKMFVDGQSSSEPAKSFEGALDKLREFNGERLARIRRLFNVKDEVGKDFVKKTALLDAADESFLKTKMDAAFTIDDLVKSADGKPEADRLLMAWLQNRRVRSYGFQRYIKQ